METLQFPGAAGLETGKLKLQGMVFVAEFIGGQDKILAEVAGFRSYTVEKTPQLVLVAVEALPGQTEQFVRRQGLLAGLHCYGPTRTNDYDPLPKWRSKAKRPSCLDLVRLLRRQLAADPIKFPTGEKKVTQEAMLNGAAA